MNNETASAPESAGAELPAQETPAPAIPKIKVVVVQQAVTEGKKKYLKNQVLEVTPDRAIALGNFVRPWVDPKMKVTIESTLNGKVPQGTQIVDEKVATPDGPAIEAPDETPAPEVNPEPVQHTD